MTNRPPSNVKNVNRVSGDSENRTDSPCVLAHGIDSLVVSMQVEWADRRTFDRLADLMAEARSDKAEVPVVLACDGGDESLMNLQPHGSGGYAWLLISNEWSIKIGDWLQPQQRPSVVVEVRSETLWTHGPDSCVQRVRALIETAGGEVSEVRVSRVDVCADVLLPADEWRESLRDQMVTRAVKMAAYHSGDKLSGFMVGRGVVLCRLYDKALEIAEQSQKTWMYKVWGIGEVPSGHKVIRVEFEVRREVLKDAGLGDWDLLRDGLENLWAYCSQKWLRVVVEKTHHTTERLLDWWRVVQGAFVGAMDAVPAVRLASHEQDLRAAVGQVRGYMTSIVAMLRQGDEEGRFETVTHESLVWAFDRMLRRYPVDDAELTDAVNRKLAKHITSGDEFAAQAAYEKLIQSRRGRVGGKEPPREPRTQQSR